MEILQVIEDRGYPADYLLSRVRSRRVFYRNLIADRSSDEIWRHLLMEYRWIYSQMNGALREIFRYVFIYSEIRTIFMCLRYKKGEYEKIPKLLQLSLLSDDLKELLMMDSDFTVVVRGIEDAFLSISHRFRGIEEIFMKHGSGGFEQALMNIYLENIFDHKIHRIIRDFFSYVIDSRNIIAVYKHIRWNMRNEPQFIEGGSIKEAGLKGIFKRRDVLGLSAIVHKLTGIVTDTGNIENSLLKGINRFLRKTAKDPLSIGVLMEHLWRCYAETIDAGIKLYGREINRGIFESETIP